MANFFEEVTRISKDPKLSANWIMGELLAHLNKENITIDKTKITSKSLGKLIKRIKDGTISGKIAKDVFEEMWKDSKDPDQIIKTKGLTQVSDTREIEEMIEAVLKENSSQVEKYNSGKEKIFGFFVGQVMKISEGKANPEQVNKILKKKLKE